MAGKDSGKDGRKPADQDQDQGRDRDRGPGPAGDMAYEPSVNQTAHQPMPASHHDDAGQAAVRQSEEHWRRSHGGTPPARDEAGRGKGQGDDDDSDDGGDRKPG